jgi:DNA-binding response OmpR family regulator
MSKILIVEDDLDFAQSLVEFLDLRGYQAVMAGSSAEALRLACEGSFDVYFIDINLPDATGVETCRAIRDIAPDSSVVLMTAYNVQQFSAWTKDSGAVEVLQKPFNPWELAQKIDIVTGRTG